MLGDVDTLKVLVKKSPVEHGRYWLDANAYDLGMLDYRYLYVYSKLSSTFVPNTTKPQDFYFEIRDKISWFQQQHPVIYQEDLQSYAVYLRYCVIMNMLQNKEVVVSEMENYFTNELLAFMQSTRFFVESGKKKKESGGVARKNFEGNAIAELAKYCKVLRRELEWFLEATKNSQTLHPNFSFYFTSMYSDDSYKFTLPLVSYGSRASKNVEVFLILPYHGLRKPNWFTRPSVFKIFKYFLELGIRIDHMHISWYCLDDYFAPIVKESIPLTDNVMQLVQTYGNLTPVPLINIFSTANPYYYTQTRVTTLLEENNRPKVRV